MTVTPRFLADENVPLDAIYGLRQAGILISSISEDCPSVSDEQVLDRAQLTSQVLVTFDKDFGELAFRRGRVASRGVILFRPRVCSLEYVTKLLIHVLGQDRNWDGHFSVVDDFQTRVIPLPTTSSHD